MSKIGKNEPVDPKRLEQGPVQDADSAEDAAKIRQAKESATEKEARLRVPELPDEHQTLSREPSPLANILASGLQKLAEREGWSQQGANSLNTMIGAMMKTASTVPRSAEPPRHLEGQFAAILAKAHGEMTPEVKTDAKRLLQSAVFALGTEGLEGSKHAVEAQLEADLGVIKDALGEALGNPNRGPALAETKRALDETKTFLQGAKQPLGASNAEALSRLAGFIELIAVLQKYSGSTPQ